MVRWTLRCRFSTVLMMSFWCCKLKRFLLRVVLGHMIPTDIFWHNCNMNMSLGTAVASGSQMLEVQWLCVALVLQRMRRETFCHCSLGRRSL